MSIAAMKQALEALTEHGAPYLRHGVDWDNAITALRAAISEQEKCEPVQFRYKFLDRAALDAWIAANAIPLHPAPVERGTGNE